MKFIKKILFYIFGKISNGILFIVLGLLTTMIGVTSNLYVIVMVGAAVVTSGVALSVIRESQYQEAVSDISKLRKNQQLLRKSIRILHSRVKLLQTDLSDAQSQISQLRSMKVVEFANNKHALSGRLGPAFKADDSYGKDVVDI